MPDTPLPRAVSGWRRAKCKYAPGLFPEDPGHIEWRRRRRVRRKAERKWLLLPSEPVDAMARIPAARCHGNWIVNQSDSLTVPSGSRHQCTRKGRPEYYSVTIEC